MTRRRAVAGWGFAGEEASPAEVDRLTRLVAVRFPDADLGVRPAVAWQDAPVAPPRITPPPALEGYCTSDREARLLHARGRSYTDVVALRRGDFGAAPDVVATPRDATEVAAVLDWCADAGIACVPFGGGTSVVGGVTPPAGERPVVTLSTRGLRRVVEVDAVSRAARVQAGATGPEVEDGLRRHGFTLRFFPQSFELSTLGGWIATRAAGHYATGPTGIDDLVESVTAVTPTGLWSSRRLPRSGAGPSPDRLLLGSEGILGVVTEAWVRVLPRPQYRAAAAVSFPDFGAGAAAVRAVAHSGLTPANCRLLDPTEALLNGAGDGTGAVLLLGFESARAPVDAELHDAMALCRDHGGAGEVPGDKGSGGADGGNTAQRWRRAFLRAPYLRDALVGLGVLTETFETAVTWDRFAELHSAVIRATAQALAAVCGDGVVTCRLTHAYPDGAAPYFTVVAPARRGAEAQQWAAVKRAAGDAILDAGGTITHHHAVGRDHRAWYDRQRPEPFARALAAAKAAVDPRDVLNPGVLLGG